MKTKVSGAKYSAIVGIGEELKKRSLESGQEYLALNRGVNAVTLIDLNPVVAQIDFNSTDIQVYPANTGVKVLRDAINEEYFDNSVSSDHIFLTNGGMGALDLIVRCLDHSEIWAQDYYWGAYRNIMAMSGVEIANYPSFEWLRENIDKVQGKVVMICDPNNPLGNKYPDDQLLEMVKFLSAHEVTVIWDGPYRRLFKGREDDMYQKLAGIDNVIISESFSKSIGLSGQRLGFVYVKDEVFRNELSVKILYATNGVNAFAQHMISKLLTTVEGRKAVEDFKRITVDGISKNIKYLKEKGLLADQYYQTSDPVGIFVVVNKDYDTLMEHRIGSVPLEFFTPNKEEAKGCSRICVSVEHEKFKTFFDRIN